MLSTAKLLISINVQLTRLMEYCVISSNSDSVLVVFIPQFVEGDVEEDLGSDSGEGDDEDDTACPINDATLDGLESLSLIREVRLHFGFNLSS